MALIKTSISAASLSLDWAAGITQNDARVGASFDLDTNRAVELMVNYSFARLNGTLYTNSPRIRLQLSPATSGTDNWYGVALPTIGLGSSVASTTLNGAVSAGATSCTVTSGTNITAGEMLFLGHTTTVANYEIVVVKSISGTTVTFEEACTNAHDNGAAVTGQADRFQYLASVGPARRGRIIVDTENIGATCGLISRVEACYLYGG